MSARKNKKNQTLSSVEFRKIMDALAPPTWEEVQLLRKVLRDQSRRDAIEQIVEGMPEGSGSFDVAPSFQAGAFLGTFQADDGTELALARLMVAATNAAMDCFARANAKEIPVRDLELNYAIRLSLAVASLGRALDHHRGPDREEFIEAPVRKRSPTKRQTRPSATASPDQASCAGSNGSGDKKASPPQASCSGSESSANKARSDGPADKEG
jgi:hypothetical protein